MPKKIALLLTVLLLAASMALAENIGDIAGGWRTAEDDSGSWMTMYVDLDGSGFINHMPDDMGVAISVEEDADCFVVHMGSDENETELMYDPEENGLWLRSYDSDKEDSDVTKYFFYRDATVTGGPHIEFGDSFIVSYDECLTAVQNEDGSVTLIPAEGEELPLTMRFRLVENATVSELETALAAEAGTNEVTVARGLYDFSEDMASLIGYTQTEDDREHFINIMIVQGFECCLVATADNWLTEDEDLNTSVSDTISYTLSTITPFWS